jgi:hypothetical protein
MKNKTQKCRHPFFYTISDHVYCNSCHEYLGFFDPWKLRGFVKKTQDEIEEEYLNEKTVKVDVSNNKHSRIKALEKANKEYEAILKLKKTNP